MRNGFLVTDGWAANAELYWRTGRYARRVESVPSVERHDLRQRPSRLRPAEEAMNLWRARSTFRATPIAPPAEPATVTRSGKRRRCPDDSTAGPAAGAAAGKRAAPTPPATRDYPFAVGETLTYSAKLGMLTLGSGTLQVAGIDSVRGVETFRLRFRLQGKTVFYSLDDVLESWVATDDFSSHRFVQDFVENDKPKHRTFEIFPDSGFYREKGRDTTFSSPSTTRWTTPRSSTSSGSRRSRWARSTSSTGTSGRRRIRSPSRW